jgi:hypothetical protein
MITTFKQEDSPPLLPQISIDGCAFLSAIYLTVIDYNAEEVNEIYASCVHAGLIGADCTILDWARFLEGISVSMKLKYKTAQESYVCAPNEKQIIKWWLSNVQESHFTVGDGNGNVAWDPEQRSDIMRAFATFQESVIITVT